MSGKRRPENCERSGTEEMFACPVEAALDVLGGRWKPIIICRLMDGTHRFGELRRKVRGVSERMLTQHLKELADDGIVTRRVFKEVPPRVEYSLTEFGITLKPVMEVMGKWGKRHLERIEAGAARRRRTRVRRDRNAKPVRQQVTTAGSRVQ